MLLQRKNAAGTTQTSGKRQKVSGLVLDGQLVENDARRRWFGTQVQAPWASQFEVVATIVAATTDRVASAW